MQNRLQARVHRTFDGRKAAMASRDRGPSGPVSLAEDPRVWSAEATLALRTSPQPLRVLVIDNDMRAADFLEVLLHAAGFLQTRVAYTAHAALAIAADFRPEAVLVELDMRDLGSYQLAQTLRERAQLQRVRLIAVTESRAHRGRDIARDAGFERYLLKPVTAIGLAACLSEDAHA
jgi:two-component system CheB/CheR fusion protein